MVVRRALGISGIAQVIAFALGMVNVIVVSRLLMPAEIGIFSVAVSVMGLAHIFREFGVGQYLVQAAQVGPRQFRAAFSVTLITSWVVALALYLLRSPMASFYDHDGISDILFVLALNFVILPFGTPLLSMMRRDLQFGRLAWATIVSSFVQTIVTIGAALAGESYMSMAWGSIASQACKILHVNWMRPGETFILPTLSGLREVVRFGSLASLASIVRQLGASAPDLILGRTLGFVDVAFYSRAVGLNRMLVDRVNELVRGVHFPTFARDVRAGGDAALLFARTTNYLLAFTAPTLAVLAVLADPLILFLFGAQWSRSTPLAAIICTGLILTSPYSLYGLSLTATGHVSTYLRAELAIQGIRISILATSIWVDLEHVVMLLLCAYLAEAFIAQIALKRALGLRFQLLIKQTWTAIVLVPFTIAGPLGVVMLFRSLDITDGHRFAILVSGGVSAAGGWLLGVWVTNHVMKAEVVNLYLKLREKTGW